MEGFKHSGSSEDELHDLFKKLDVNMNGEIMYTEFLAATLEADGELEEAQLEEAFDMISKKSKYITLKNCMKIVGDSKNMSKRRGKNTKKDEMSELKAEIEAIFKNKEKYSYEDFAMMFEHGFDARRNMDAIFETSLNEEQLDALKQDELVMSTIRE